MAPSVEHMRTLLERLQAVETLRVQANEVNQRLAEAERGLAEAYKAAGVAPISADNEPVRRRSGARLADRALEFLTAHPDQVVNPEQLADLLGGDMLTGSLHTALNRLVREGKAVRRGPKLFSLASAGEAPPPSANPADEPPDSEGELE